MGNTIGVVQDSAGRPIGDALVFVEGISVAIPEITIRTNSQGRCELNLPQGRYRITACTPDGERGATEYQKGVDSDNIVIQINGS